MKVINFVDKFQSEPVARQNMKKKVIPNGNLNKL